MKNLQSITFPNLHTTFYGPQNVESDRIRQQVQGNRSKSVIFFQGKTLYEDDQGNRHLFCEALTYTEIPNTGIRMKFVPEGAQTEHEITTNDTYYVEVARPRTDRPGKIGVVKADQPTKIVQVISDSV